MGVHGLGGLGMACFKLVWDVVFSTQAEHGSIFGPGLDLAVERSRTDLAENKGYNHGF